MENLFLARNESKEDIAITNFLNAYVENFGSSTQKSPTELFSLLLEQLSATCDVVSQEIATPESEKLIQTNQFFESIVNQLQGLQPRKFDLTLKIDEVPTFIENLIALKSLTSDFEHSSYICDRIDYFANKLEEQATQQASAYFKRRRLVITAICILIAIAIFDMTPLSDILFTSSGDDSIWGILLFIVMIICIFIIGVSSKSNK